MRKIISLLIALVMLVTVLGACAGNNQNPPADTSTAPASESQTTQTNEGDEPAQEAVSLTFWHHEAPEHRIAAFDKLIELYQAEQPNVTITQELVSWGDAWIKLLAAIEAGDPPDFQFGIPDVVNTAYRADAILPVPDLVKEIDAKYEYYPNVLKMYYHDNEYWGVPVMTMPFAWVYRPSLLEQYLGTTEPPKTWDQVLDYSKRITEAGNGEVFGIALGGGKNLFVDEQTYMFLTAAGGKFFDEKGNIAFNSPETIHAIQTYSDLYKYSPPGSEAWTWGETEMNLAAGVAAMAPYPPSIQIRMNDMDNDDLGFTDMPVPKEGDPQGTLTYPNDAVIFKITEERGTTQAVKDFLMFITDPEVNIYLTSEMEPGTFAPCTKAAEQNETYWNNPVIKRFLDVNKTTIETIKYGSLYGFEYDQWVNLGIGDITGANILSSTFQQALSGQMTAEEAAAWGAEQMERMSIPIN